MISSAIIFMGWGIIISVVVFFVFGSWGTKEWEANNPGLYREALDRHKCQKYHLAECTCVDEANLNGKYYQGEPAKADETTVIKEEVEKLTPFETMLRTAYTKDQLKEMLGQ